MPDFYFGENMKKKIVLILFTLAISLILAGCSLFGGSSSLSNEPLPLVNGTTQGNILSYGFCVKYGDELIFLNTSNDYYPLGSTVLSNPETGESSVLVEDGGLYMNLVGDMLYYCKPQGVFRVDINDPVPELVLQKYVRLLQLKDDVMYYVEDYVIDARTVDGEETDFSPIENADCLNVYGNKLYYISTEDSFIYSAELDGSGTEIVFGKEASMFTIMDNTLYYLDAVTGYLVKKELDGKFAIAIVEHALTGFNINRSGIYYTRNIDGAGTCCNSNVDGGNEETLSEFGDSSWHIVCMFNTGALLAKVEEMPGV